jgi:hypothetical protein
MNKEDTYKIGIKGDAFTPQRFWDYKVLYASDSAGLQELEKQGYGFRNPDAQELKQIETNKEWITKPMQKEGE